MIQRGVIQRGVIQRGVIQRGVIQRGVIQRGVIQRGVIQRGVVQRGNHVSRDSPLSRVTIVLGTKVVELGLPLDVFYSTHTCSTLLP